MIQGDQLLKSGQGRILVFASSVNAAESTAAALREAGIGALLYHKNVPARDRDAALQTMRR